MAESLAEKLFGRVVYKRTGTHVPDPKTLREPFSGPIETDYDSVAYTFCRGWGTDTQDTGIRSSMSEGQSAELWSQEIFQSPSRLSAFPAVPKSPASIP